MSIKVLSVAVMLMAACQGAAPLLAQEAPTNVTPETQAEARVHLAERFCDLGLSLARDGKVSKATVEQSAALIEAATRQNPLEPRFFRTLATAREQLGDVDGAIAAWVKYRGLLPDDRVAQCELIDLYMSRQQSAGEKVTYLSNLLGKDTLHPHVKAHIAAKLVPLLDQRSRGEALAMLAQARKYYPLPEVTLLRWQMLAPDATPAERFSALLDILRSNPVQPDALAALADTLSGAGLSEQALTCYGILMDVHARQGTEPAESSAINYLAERYRAGETTVAADQLDAVLQKYPYDPETWLLRLTVSRGDESPSRLLQARQAFVKQLSLACSRIDPASAPVTVPPKSPPTTAPTTEPAEAEIPLPAIEPVVARARELNDPGLTNPLVAALEDLAWFEIYFNHKPAAAVGVMSAIKTLTNPDDTTRRRLEGWYLFETGDDLAARALFSAQQESDPLSALGLMRVEDHVGHSNEAASIAGKILVEPHVGVLGAIIWQATKGRGYRPATQPARIASIQEELAKFPRDWLQVVRTPNRFYSLRAEPAQVGHRLGDPMLAVVTIENECKLDISVGDYGLIKPTIVFDAQIRGGNPRTFRAIAVDRVMGRLVLLPGESITQTVRIDQADLSDALHSRPSVPQSIEASVVTNPSNFGNRFGAGAGGYAKNFTRMFLRTPLSLAQDRDRRKLLADLAGGSPSEKMLDIEVLAAYVTQYAQPNATAEEKAFAQQFTNAIESCRTDSTPGIKLWASYTLAILLTGPEEQRVINEMMKSNAWESRLLALVAGRYLPPEAYKKLAADASGDTDSVVKAYATALGESLQNPTTQPAVIQPADGKE